MANNYILDSSALMSHYDLHIEKIDKLIIPYSVLESINRKMSDVNLGSEARAASRSISHFLSLASAREKKETNFKYSFINGHECQIIIDKAAHGDVRTCIIEIAIKYNKESKDPFIVITEDPGLSMLCSVHDIECQTVEEAFLAFDKSTRSQYKIKDVLVDDEIINDLYTKHEAVLSKKRLFPNQFLSIHGSDGTIQDVIHISEGNIKLIPDLKKNKDKGSLLVSPKNREQKFAIYAMMSHTAPMVILEGPSGTGKTLIAFSVALDMLEKGKCEKIIIVRPIVPIGAELGFFKGSKDDKLVQWSMPFFDAATKLGLQDMYEMIEGEKIELCPISTMRGRSFSNSVVILDDAQNVTKRQIISLATRVGIDSKLFITGDIDQVDDVKLISSRTNGLYYFINNMIGSHVCSYIPLSEPLRSDICKEVLKRCNINNLG